MDKPFDYLVTRTWEATVHKRRLARSHTNLEIPALEADFTAEPGPLLARFTGLLGEAASEGLIVGESESGYLTVDELITARVKFHIYLRQHLLEGRRANRDVVDEVNERSALLTSETKRGYGMDHEGEGREEENKRTRVADGKARIAKTAYPEDGCLLVVAERVTEEVITRGLPGMEVAQLEPGLWFSSPGFRMYIVSMEKLAFRDETAVLHLLCRGPHMAQALRWLVLHEDAEASECGRYLSEVVEAMHATSRQEYLTEAEREEVHRLFLAKEAAQLEKGRQEGKQEGKREGERKGKREAVLALWLYKFGEPAPWVNQRIGSCESMASLDAILKDVVLAADLAGAEEAVRVRLGNGRG